MDFAALMNNAMGKKPTTSKPTSTTTPSESEPNPRFQKRSEIEAAREAAYATEQKELQDQRAARAAAKRKLEDDAALEKEAREEKRRKLADESRRQREDEEWEAEQARRRRLGLKEKERKIEGEDVDAVDGEEDIVEEELRGLLRELGHPVVLFGEGHNGRVKRYRKLTVKMTDGPIPTTLELLEGTDVKVEEKIPEDKAGPYEMAMEAEREDTTASRNAYATMVQTRENMKPLFRKMEKDDMPNDLLKPIVEIVHALQQRRYVDANDGYLRLSIGKAAWPIGVTMVGIHERSAREKLHDGEKGHVMGDEVTRKFLQSIKRCLTFAQVRWPPTDIRQLMG